MVNEHKYSAGIKGTLGEHPNVSYWSIPTKHWGKLLTVVEWEQFNRPHGEYQYMVRFEDGDKWHVLESMILPLDGPW